jgi:formylglycine-generating enzyme required for sulfatase activity
VANKDGVPSFCIAKFEMKHPTDVDGLDNSYPYSDRRDNNAVPVSQPQNRPWVEIGRNAARAACERVKMPGFTVALISNGEWQAVARNIENTAANWSGSKVGEGIIPDGHAAWDSLPVTNEADPYDGAIVYRDSPLNNWARKRTHQLSTGEVVWDLAGNVWEWVADDMASLGVDLDNLYMQRNGILSERNKTLFGPFGKFGAKQRMVDFNAYADTAVRRGGYFMCDNYCGLFSVKTGVLRVPNYFGGFRCVARPVK